MLGDDAAAARAPREALPREARRPDDARIPAGVAVRSARQEDLGQLLGLLAQLDDGGEGAAPTPELSSTFARMLASEDRTVLVAETGAGLVGTLDLVIVPALTHGGRPWAVIEDIVVDAARRRRGIGGALLDQAFALASHAGCSEVQLVSHERRRAAHSLYASAGFDAPVRGFRRYLDRELAARRGADAART